MLLVACPLLQSFVHRQVRGLSETLFSLVMFGQHSFHTGIDVSIESLYHRFDIDYSKHLEYSSFSLTGYIFGYSIKTMKEA